MQLQTTYLSSRITDEVFRLGGQASFLEFGGLRPAPVGLRLSLRRWGALLALAGLALPGVRAAEAGESREDRARRSPPAAEQAVPAAEPETPLLPVDGPWEAAVTEPALPAPAPVPGPAAANGSVPAAAAGAAPAAAQATETARSAPGETAAATRPAPAPAAATATGGVGDIVPAGREHLRPVLARYARESNLPADLVMALAWRESSWRVGAVSKAGAVGVLQLMPDTVTFASRDLMGLRANLDAGDATANIRMGTRFLAHLVKVYDGSYRRALIAYNQGVTALRNRGSYPGAERFADSVLSLRAEFAAA